MTSVKPFLVLFLSLICSYAAEEERIFNGDDAKVGQFPYQAFLMMSTSQGIYVCGGSVISEEWIVTAAHCTLNADNVTVILGTVDRKDTDAVRLVSTEHYEHPDYNADDIKNDIAFVKLPQALTFDDKVNKVALPKKADAPVDTFAGQKATASGWGNTHNFQTSITRYLQYSELTVMTNALCNGYYSNVGDKEICTSNLRSFSGTCSGDSGGPLVIQRDGGPVLIALTSWGFRFCQTLFPSVFTNVAAFLDYLNEVTGIAVE